MTRVWTLTILLLITAMTAWAQTEAPTSKPVQAPAFMLPEGAAVNMEINLSQGDILGMVKQAIPAFKARVMETNNEVADFVNTLNFDDLYAAIEGVQAVRVVQFSQPKPIDADALLAHFAAQASEENGWTRIYFLRLETGATFAAYTQCGSSYYSVLADPNTGLTGVATVTGPIDIVKLAGWAGHVVSTIPKARACLEAYGVK
jgi:hypothetical protein